MQDLNPTTQQLAIFRCDMGVELRSTVGETQATGQSGTWTHDLRISRLTT